MRSKPPFVIISWLMLVMLLWGGSFIAIKFGLRYLTPYELVMARFVPSAIMLLPIGLWFGKQKGRGGLSFWRSLSKKEIILVLVASFLAVPGYHVCLNYGETLIPAGWASLVISLNPAFIALFSVVVLHERITLRLGSGIFVAFLGLLVITFGQDAPMESGQTATTLQKSLGVLITLGAVVSWGAFTTISKKLLAGREPIENLGWIMALGAAWSLPFYHGGVPAKLVLGGSELFWSLMFLSVGCTVFSFVIWFWALERWTASKAGAFIYFVPLFALVIGAFMLDEPITFVTLLGAAVVLGGVILAASGKPGAVKVERVS